MTEEQLKKIEEVINNEDRPEDLWFLETVQALVDEVRALRLRIASENR